MSVFCIQSNTSPAEPMSPNAIGVSVVTTPLPSGCTMLSISAFSMGNERHGDVR